MISGAVIEITPALVVWNAASSSRNDETGRSVALPAAPTSSRMARKAPASGICSWVLCAHTSDESTKCNQQIINFAKMEPSLRRSMIG